MKKQEDKIEIVDIFYADCVPQPDNSPRWVATKIREELTDQKSLDKLLGQLKTLRRKRKLVYTFSDQVIEVEHPKNASVKSILQTVLELPLDNSGLGPLKEYGTVLAQKYILTPYSRTRLFMLIRGKLNNDKYLFALVADMKDDTVQRISGTSYEFISVDLPNIYGDLKKGSMYPALVDGKREKDVIQIFEEGDTKYYPQSLECIPKQTPESEVKSLANVLANTCSPTSDQLGLVFNDLRKINRSSFGNNELFQILKKNKVKVDKKKLSEEWDNQFLSSQYEISPTALSLESVSIVISLDEFEIKCPLSYFPDRIDHNREGGYHYLAVKGREYKEVRIGQGKVQLNN